MIDAPACLEQEKTPRTPVRVIRRSVNQPSPKVLIGHRIGLSLLRVNGTAVQDNVTFGL